jgi:bacterioferritin
MSIAALDPWRNYMATNRNMSDTATPTRSTALIDGLNDDLAREFQAIVRYTTFAASVSGPFRPQIAELFRKEIADELGHAHFLADKVAALGGQPTTVVPPVEVGHDVRDMLQKVVAAEREDIEVYTRRAREADEAGEVGLKVQLENIVLDETGHMEDMRKILEGWK